MSGGETRREPCARAMVLAAVGIAVMAALLYVPSLGGEFLNWDDGWLVVDNPYLDEVEDLGRIVDPTAWRASLGAEYLPIRDLSFWVDRHLWGLDPFGYRLVNALLYGLVCALAVTVLRDLTRSDRAAVIGAALFAVHPLHVESVAWISERKGLLAAVFLMAALIAYRRSRTGARRATYVAAVLLFVLAALSKSTVHFFALLLPGLEWIDARREGRASQWGRWIAFAVPFLAISGAAIAINAHHQSAVGANYGWEAGSLDTAAQVVGTTAIRYVTLLVFPVGLSAEYEAVSGPWAWGAVGGLVGLLVLAGVGIWRNVRSGSVVLLAILAWLPVSNLVALPNSMADRYLFLASLGVAGLLGLAFDAGLRAGRAARVTSGAVLVLAVVGFASLSLARMSVWTDRLSLWTDATEKAPGSARAHQNLGEVRLARGETAEAFASFHRMLEVEPEVGAWYVFVAGRHQAAGDLAGAERILRAGRAKVPSYPGTSINLAHLLLTRASREARAGELRDEAERLLVEVAESKGDDPGQVRALARFNLGALELSRGRLERGIALTRQALDMGLSPHDEVMARRNLAAALRQTDHEVEAEQEESRVRELVDWLGPGTP